MPSNTGTGQLPERAIHGGAASIEMQRRTKMPRVSLSIHLYRMALHERFRLRLWHARQYLLHTLRVKDWPPARESSAQRRLAAGKPITTAELAGLKLFVDLRDNGVGRPLYVTRGYEPAETEFLKKTLRSGMTFVDIGANIGYFTCIAAQAIGPRGRVISFEPDQHNFDLLKRNVRRNQLDNVELHNIALGSESGSVRLFRSDTNFGDHRICSDPGVTRESIEVRVAALDHCLASSKISKIDVIKMDVQGYEHQVTRGMRHALLSSDKLVVLTEFWPHGIATTGSNPQDFFKEFIDAGFSAGVLGNDGIVQPVTYQEACMRLPSFELAQPDSCYINLVFSK